MSVCAGVYVFDFRTATGTVLYVFANIFAYLFAYVCLCVCACVCVCVRVCYVLHCRTAIGRAEAGGCLVLDHTFLPFMIL